VESNRALQTDTYADERRTSPRRPCRVRATVEPDGGTTLSATTVDIGRDGMALLLSRPLPDGTPCRIVFSIFCGGGVQRLELQARAVKSVFVPAHVRVGFAFTGVPPAAGAVLAEFVGYGKR